MKTALVAVLAVVTLTACASKDSSASEESGPIVGTWKQISAEERIGTDDWTPSADAECRLDNTEEYEAGGRWTLYDGNKRCGSTGTGIRHGSWRLAASDTKVVYTYDGIQGEYETTVEVLTETELVLTKATGETNGRQVRSVYEKQRGAFGR